jgi:hypothetical protein
MDLEELKKEAMKRGFTRIWRDEDAKFVTLKDWKGVSPYLGTLHFSASIDYDIDGDKVWVRLDGGYWYVLS